MKKKKVGTHGSIPPNARRLSALLACGDQGAVREIVIAMRAAETVQGAADALGVHRVSLHRWLLMPAVEKALAAASKK